MDNIATFTDARKKILKDLDAFKTSRPDLESARFSKETKLIFEVSLHQSNIINHRLKVFITPLNKRGIFFRP